MQATDAGILIYQMRKSQRFKAAMKVVKNTSFDVKVQKASEEVDKYLTALIASIRRVVCLHILMWSRNKVKECVPLQKFKIGALKELIAENSYSEWSPRFLHPITNGSLKGGRFVTGRDDSQTLQIHRRKKSNKNICIYKCVERYSIANVSRTDKW